MEGIEVGWNSTTPKTKALIVCFSYIPAICSAKRHVALVFEIESTASSLSLSNFASSRSLSKFSGLPPPPSFFPPPFYCKLPQISFLRFFFSASSTKSGGACFFLFFLPSPQFSSFSPSYSPYKRGKKEGGGRRCSSFLLPPLGAGAHSSFFPLL